MSEFTDCLRFANVRQGKLLTMDYLDTEVYLSVNVPIPKLPNIKKHVTDFLKNLETNEKDIYYYPEESIHLSLLALAGSLGCWP